MFLIDHHIRSQKHMYSYTRFWSSFSWCFMAKELKLSRQ